MENSDTLDRSLRLPPGGLQPEGYLALLSHEDGAWALKVEVEVAFEQRVAGTERANLERALTAGSLQAHAT